VSVEAIKEKNLSLVADVTTENKRSTVTTMKDRARKRYVHSYKYLGKKIDFRSEILK